MSEVRSKCDISHLMTKKMECAHRSHDLFYRKLLSTIEQTWKYLKHVNLFSLLWM